MTHKTSTSDLAAAMLILSRDIETDDGVANAAVLEAGQRLIEMAGQANVLKGLLADCYSSLDPAGLDDSILRGQIDVALEGVNVSAAHTPGPWCIGDSNLSVSQFAVLQSESTRRHSTICRMAIGEPGYGEIMANASLIAAAPDLLEALRAARRLIELVFPFEGDVTRKIDKAIAKATRVST